MVFANRQEAGKLLSKEISKKRFDIANAVLVAIPRGGVSVAYEISIDLNITLTVLVIKKLGAPNNPELAIGATASFGKPVLDRWLIRDLNVSSEYIKKEAATRKKEARAREKMLNLKIKPEGFEGKIAIVVDDGIATGQTVRMAAKVLKQFNVLKLVLAVPCASPKVLEQMEKDFDEVICLEVSSQFWAVGQFYKDFTPVEDRQVKEILKGQLTINN